MGWYPYPAVNPPNVPYHLSYPPARPPGASYYPPHSVAPYYPSHYPAGPPSTPHYPPDPIASSLSQPLVEDDGRKSGSPSDDDEDILYPTISDFLKQLATTETGSDFHYFTNYTDGFHQKGFYRINQLADESFSVKDMMESIVNLKEGTARLIKKWAVKQVKKIRKGKGKK